MVTEVIMGSICSSNNNNNVALPPKDLGELLQLADKGGGSSPWLGELRTHLQHEDRASLGPTTTGTGLQAQARATLNTGTPAPSRSLAWREALLQFIIEVRGVLRKGASEAAVSAGLARLGRDHLMAEGGLALADRGLRERLVEALEHWGEAGAGGARRVLGTKAPTREAVMGMLQEAYLDTLVWDKMEKLYRKFCEKQCGGGLPPLAVLLSIL